ncbi:SURF1 family protein [Shimia isoporae]|uniref:SURF1 family protein n=1 Tax=Shimia isoporae TaxID=647720 RepID=UPI0010463046|nr:SURF1 family protein [Shimia isoporae]
MRLILPLFFGILGTVVLVSLGNWQVQRLAWKEEVLADINERIVAEPVALPAAPDEDSDRYLPVTVSGAFTGEELHFLASTKQAGAVYRVVARFETDAGRAVMVDRGWVKTEDKNVNRGAAEAIIVGNLHWPDERDNFTPDNDVDGNIWFARDIGQMAEALMTEPVLVVAREVSENSAGVTPLPVDTAGIPNDHLGYAVTWYGLAIVWVAMTLYYLRRTRKTKKA